MKQLLRLAMGAALTIVVLSQSFGQGGSRMRNPLLEYCTGTWCQWCPCGHTIIAGSVLADFPHTIVMSYHGPANTASDPYSTFPGNAIIATLGLSSYPTGNVDRTASSPLSRSSWYSIVSARVLFMPNVLVSFSKNFNSTTRELSMEVHMTSQSSLNGTYMMSVALLEDSLIYSQTGNSSCPGGNPYVHNHVVRAMINGVRGDTLNSGSSWAQGVEVVKNVTYSVPSNLVAEHCKVVVFVYRAEASLNLSEVMQAEEAPLLAVTNTHEAQSTPEVFELQQNYPNPFNPSTTIRYTIPHSGHVLLTVLDMLGREVKTLVSGMKDAGTSELSFDASGLSSGLYFYRLQVGSFTATKKMMLVR